MTTPISNTLSRSQTTETQPHQSIKMQIARILTMTVLSILSVTTALSGTLSLVGGGILLGIALLAVSSVALFTLFAITCLKQVERQSKTKPQPLPLPEKEPEKTESTSYPQGPEERVFDEARELAKEALANALKQILDDFTKESSNAIWTTSKEIFSATKQSLNDIDAQQTRLLKNYNLTLDQLKHEISRLEESVFCLNLSRDSLSKLESKYRALILSRAKSLEGKVEGKLNVVLAFIDDLMKTERESSFPSTVAAIENVKEILSEDATKEDSCESTNEDPSARSSRGIDSASLSDEKGHFSPKSDSKNS